MTVISCQTRTLLALSYIKGIGPASLKKVAGIPYFAEQSLKDWSVVVPLIAKAIGDRSEAAVWVEATKWADDQIAEAEIHNARILSSLDEEYPVLLSQTKDDPFILFVCGNLDKRNQKSVAIIGTREPTQHGRLIAQRITQFFAERKWSVVSGLAIGSDAIAHQTTLNAGGHTIAVLAHGLQMIAPSVNKKLAMSILDSGGALVSEYPFGVKPIGSYFVKRDRTQAGMAQGVVMIQSDVRGGSLHASRAALDYRRWLAVPYPTDKDKDLGEPKIQANLVIAEGSLSQRAELLRCPVDSLRLVKVVRGKDDYLRLVDEESEPMVLDHRDLLVVDSSNISDKDHDVEADLAQEITPDHAIDNSSAAELYTDRALDFDLETTSEFNEGSPSSSQVRVYWIRTDIQEINSIGKMKIAKEVKERARSIIQENPSFSMVWSRILYVQACLDDLKRTSNSNTLSIDEKVTRSRFQLEDVLWHMKRTFDDALQICSDEERNCLTFLLSRELFATHSQKSLLLSDADAAVESTSEPFFEILASIIADFPRSIKVDDFSSEIPLKNEIKHVSLKDVVQSFNELTSKFLASPWR
ncbi:DNA-processing protein DprA [Herbaspirillum rubrisubalbicans]|uniref:DNA-processing protein DprA n=1 Tax=Herbaspirillum rubrisubalbicans TaxID=80842 RepID=UPI000DD4DD03|nr:DNA-processing protein DprA [Herbaspirillum rubrisubalbicans]